MSFRVKLAETVFTLDTLYPDTEEFCQKYRADRPEKNPDGKSSAEIRISRDDIDKERIFSIREAEIEGIPVLDFTDGMLETTAVYRKMADWFSFHDAAVMHGALIALDGKGYLFIAKSGTGKTTHIRNWLKCFPQAQVINGDKPVVRLKDGRLIGYGTPWSGKEGMNDNASVPIRAIVSLHRAEQNRIFPQTLKEAFPQVMASVYHPKDPEGIKRALQFVLQMNGKADFYDLGCNMELESAQVAYRGMNAGSSLL